MLGNGLLAGFGLWVMFQVWRGYRDGIWASVIGVLALLVAYGSALFGGQEFALKLAAWGVPSSYTSFVAYPLIFFVMHSLVRYIPFLIFPGLRHKTRAHAFWGAGLGLGIGIITGLLGAWFIGLLVSISAANSTSPAALHSSGEDVASNMSRALQQTASSFVAKTAELGAGVAGMDEDRVVTVSAMLRQPDVVMGGMQQVMKSPEMRRLVQSPETKRMMALNDVNSLRQSEAFHELMSLPEMKNMQANLNVDGKGFEQSELFMAEQLTRIWRRMEYLKTDPRVSALLNDQELQQALQQNNPVALMANTKFQRLSALILDGTESVEESQMNALLLESAMQSTHPNDELGSEELGSEKMQPAVVKPFVPQTVYKWQDNKGRWQYSDWDHIPVDKRDSATKMKR